MGQEFYNSNKLARIHHFPPRSRTNDQIQYKLTANTESITKNRGTISPVNRCWSLPVGSLNTQHPDMQHTTCDASLGEAGKHFQRLFTYDKQEGTNNLT
jgi:hypothetical protein